MQAEVRVNSSYDIIDIQQIHCKNPHSMLYCIKSYHQESEVFL